MVEVTVAPVSREEGHAPQPSRDPRPAARVLVDAVQGAPPQAYPWERIDPEGLLKASLTHGVTPALALYLRERDDVPPDLATRLQGCYRDQVARHLRTMADLRRAAGVLQGAEVPWAVIKGPALAEGIWPRPDLRLYVDLDVVVGRRSMRRTLEALRTGGAVPVDRNWPMIRDRMQGEVSLTLPFGTPLDLHWHLVNDQALRRAFPFAMDELLARARPRALGSVTAPVLDPVDTVLHLAYHMVHSGGHRLVWLKDFDLAMSVPGLDHAELAERARAYGCALALAVSVRRTARVLGSCGGLATPRGGGPWVALAGAADRWRPAPQLPGERRSGRIVFQSTRARLGPSMLAAAQAAMGRAQAEDPAPEAGTSMNPLHLDRPDAVAQEAYLAALEGPTEP